MQESKIEDLTVKRTNESENGVKGSKKIKSLSKNGHSSKSVICEVNPVYESFEANTCGEIKEVFENYEKINAPFNCILYKNFLKDNEFLHALRKELMEDVDYNLKNNDLYAFRQSDDFKNLSLPNVTAIRNCFLEKVRPIVGRAMNIELLEDAIDITASKYEYNDVLLCHDDQLEGRRIAFILYLTPEWSESDGGLLNIFDHDENKQPRNVIKSIVPQWNTFAFFEVTPVSFHTVSEVLSREKCRLTVNGWFRGPGFTETVPFVEPYLNIKKCGDVNVSQEVFTSWINPLYLKKKTQTSVQRQFVESSEISLSDFLVSEKYESVASLLRGDQLRWKYNSPPNKRRFEVLEDQELPEILIELMNVFQSEAMFLTLSNLTGLKLHPLATENAESSEDEEEAENSKTPSNPRCRLQLRQWSKGCYTLVHDHDPDVLDSNAKLDINLSFNHDFETKPESGGFTSYITKENDEELLCVEPDSNCLSIVYVDGHSVRFVKYLNDSFTNVYQDLNLTFQE